MVCEPASSVDELVSQYSCTLMNLLDEHASIKSCFVVDHPIVSWYTDTISEVKCLKRKLEKQMKRIGLLVHRGMFKMAKNELL